MLFKCYRSSASEHVQEQVWQLASYVHAYAVKGTCEFYIREDRLSFALLIDPFMRHIRTKDFIE
jgi:hypothetical protein